MIEKHQAIKLLYSIKNKLLEILLAVKTMKTLCERCFERLEKATKNPIVDGLEIVEKYCEKCLIYKFLDTWEWGTIEELEKFIQKLKVRKDE